MATSYDVVVSAAEPRPPRGAPYTTVVPVPPDHPAVPEAAPGALRLPLTPV